MRLRFHWAFLALLFLLSSCRVSREAALQSVDFTILQINDVYEISPLEGGKSGGLARVATVKKELLRENPNTIAVLAGDFLSPSFIGTLKTDSGEPIAGRHMVETLNAMGLDYATFGNHEFDLRDPDLLQQRLHQSAFQYTCCNVLRVKDGREMPFTHMVNGTAQPIPPYILREFTGRNGSKARIALVGVVLPFNKQPYVKYLPDAETFRSTCQSLEGKAEVILGLTHLAIDADMALAETTPQVPLFMGGHDHNHMGHFVERTVIAKADANAKTVYIHRLSYYPATKTTQVRSTLKVIDDKIPADPATQAVVEKWESQVFGLAEKMGYQPRRVVMNTAEPLECTETIIRSSQTNFGQLAVEAYQAAMPGADVYWINSGSMRLDDRLSGAITEFDVMRTFPYGGKIVKMQLPGAVVQEALRISMTTNKGEGGYFQLLHADPKPDAQGRFLINGNPIEPERMYSVVMPQFVAEGKEANLSMLGKYKFDVLENLSPAPGASIRNDVRDIVISYMSRK
ncbi:MAG: bifunctional metallophosphatase/5'-nucleotidase [Saprospiraceae bacterium]|nr:bifunctional metallophosphatase/5'-nucleotidase [Saprospiraceae bacterium]